ncbi:MAG: type II toxin-antitoxin system MqsA family antitoxin [Candidatus Binatia bacterium]
MNSKKHTASASAAGAGETCYFCGRGVLERRRVTVDFRWGDELTVIENVPATVCNECGEQYYAAKVVRQMERLAKVRRRERELRVPVATMR